MTLVPSDAARIAETLRSAGYTGEGIDTLVGTDLTALGHRGIPVVVHRTGGGSLLDTLVRLFTAGVTVPRAALPPGLPERLSAAGLLALDADQARATVQLACYGELLLATDWGPATPNVATPGDHVLGFSPSTLTLARMTVRQPSRSTLDLGTGAGLQALLAAAHSDRVIATDLNPRAVAMARFNAALNGIATIDCREGDMFQPVEDDRFDTIVSNPPFVVGPAAGHLFMSAGRDTDAVCRQLAIDAPRHLAPGGWCQFLANWSVHPGEDWQDRLQGWLANTGCDAWVIRRGREPVDEYAALWIETDRDDPAEYAARFDTWMRWYAERDIEAVDYGLVTMRRRSDGDPTATGRIRTGDVQGDWRSSSGEDVAQAFARHDWLDRTGDAALLDSRLRVSDAVRLRHELLAVRGEWVRVAGEVRVEPGIDDPGGIDPRGEVLVARCDGATPVAALLDDLAAAVAVPADGMRPGALAVVRRLVERGVLLPPQS
ncbi:MAG TPA: methyltransferase [Candidatus Dormibacteraeota bacterium]|jgi:methylase of polypeptide subunit release factors|nr:methyltransferase [Candidatus Dormibacteraeota bacterium]